MICSDRTRETVNANIGFKEFINLLSPSGLEVRTEGNLENRSIATK